MRWFRLLTALLLVPVLSPPATAQVKSILRFEKEMKTPDREEDATESEEKAGDGEERADAQGTAGSTRRNILADEDGSGLMDAEATGLPEGIALPGQPAAIAPPGAQPPAAVEAPALPDAPPLVAPTLPGRAPVRPRGAASAPQGGVPEGIAPRPDAPRPFTYERSPVAVGTWSGYDAAVAPDPILADPVAPPGLGSGQPGKVQRPLPRLAPYGYALPPGEGTPPVARPR